MWQEMHFLLGSSVRIKLGRADYATKKERKMSET